MIWVWAGAASKDDAGYEVKDGASLGHQSRVNRLRPSKACSAGLDRSVKCHLPY